MAQKTFIRKRRQALELTQEQLGKKIGVNGRQIRRWENKEQSPRTKQIYKLCKVLYIDKEDMWKLIYDYK